MYEERVERQTAFAVVQQRVARDPLGQRAVELFYEPFKNDSSFQEEIGRQAVEKRRIASAAADLIQDGDTI
ncbi:MAG TPA: hypothetical protein VIW69_17600, partial [Candidatus Elarobacter sp.]